uniref:Protein MAK10 homolog n=1 Tax=Macrostomum lignano TaxID=282301 RepID=A0A1I8H1K3_9PLAT
MTSSSNDSQQLGQLLQEPGSHQQQQSDYSDITEQFKSAACHLQLGELLQHQSFSLYDAMTAIEMMEPKMDSGMRLDREILHPQRSAGGPLMKLSDLTDAELLGVMDESLACLASWLDGESALQSVFINLYLQCIDKIECQPLRTFCHGLLCLLQRAKDLITLANTTDEEDFNPLLYGFEAAAAEAADDERITSALEVGQPAAGRDDPRLKAYGVQGFEPLANLRQLPPSFPRCVRVFERPAAVAYLARCLDCFRQFLTDVTPAACPSYQQLYTRLALVCGLSSDAPCFARSCLRLLYCCPAQQQQLHSYGINLGLGSARLFGRHSPVEFLLASVKQFCPIAAGADLNASVRQLQGQSRQLADSLCLQLGRALLHQVCPLFSRNRSRKREKLAACLDALWPLYESCYCLDRALFPNDECRSLFLPYLTFYLFRLSRLYLLSGFSLQLYARHELPSVYFMLGDGYMYFLLVGIVQADLAIQQQLQLTHNPYTKLSRQHHRYHQQVQTLYQHHLSMLRASNYLATATFYALAALHSDGKMQQLASPHPAGESSAFKHRYQPLLQRPFLPRSITCYTNLQTMWDSRTTFNGQLDDSELDEGQQRKPASTPADVYAEATREFEKARDALMKVVNAASSSAGSNSKSAPSLATVCIEDWDGEAMIKVAKTNMVVTKLLAAGHRAGPQHPAELDFSVCPHYPVIKLLAPTAASSAAVAAAAPSSNGK